MLVRRTSQPPVHFFPIHSAHDGDQARSNEPYPNTRQIRGSRHIQQDKQPGDHDVPGRQYLHVAHRKRSENQESESTAWTERRNDMHAVRRRIH